MNEYSFNESLLVSNFFRFLRKNNGTMIDVGAHVGSSLLHFAQLGWRILAFEAEKSNYQELCENVGQFPNVECVNSLVSDISGNRKLYISSKHWGIHSIQPFHKTHTKSVNVKSVTLSQVVKERSLKHINFLKIDVEGADFLVIKGFDFKKDLPDIVMCEFMDERTVPHFKYSHRDVVEYMKEFGYSCYIFEWSKIVGGYGEKGIVKQSTKFVNFYPYSNGHNPNWGNLIFVRKPLYLIFGMYTKNYIKRNFKRG